MATIIDSLVVLLQLDAKSLSAEQKKALESFKKLEDQASRGGKGIDAWGKTTTEAFTLARNSALRFLTLLTAGMGIEKFTAYTIASGAATGRLAYQIGQTTQETALWQKAVEKLGGDGAAAGASMQGLTNQIQQFSLTGQSSIVPILRSLKIDLRDGNGELKTATQLYGDLAEAIQRNQIEPRAAHFILAQLGLDEGTIQLIMRGKDAVNQYVEAARHAGVVSDQAAPAFQEIQTAWSNLVQELETGGRTFIEQFSGPISWFLRLVTRGAHFLNTHSGVNGSKLEYEGDEAVPGTQAYQDLQLKQRGLQREPSSYKPTTIANGNLLFQLLQGNEASGDRAVSRKGAIGRNQILLSTARDYDPTATEEKLKNPEYNNWIARQHEEYLNKKYGGNIEDIEVAYNWGEGHADRWIQGGRNFSALPPETQKYLMHGRRFMADNGNATINNTTTIGQVVVNTQATDAKGIARDIKSELSSKSIAVQANTGPQ